MSLYLCAAVYKLSVKELAQHHETPLPRVQSRVAELEGKVGQHLERMGFSWK